MMSLTIFLCSIFVILLTYLAYRVKNSLNYWQSRGIPCKKPSLLIGNMAMAGSTMYDICMNYYKTFKGCGPYVGFYMLHQPAAFILDPELVKLILIKDFNKFTDRGLFSNEKDDPLTGNLFALDGHRWKTLRAQLSPTFTSGKMKYMYPTLQKVSKEFISTLSEAVKVNKIVEMHDFSARFTTDIIGTCAFGIECNSLKNPETEFRIMGRKVFTEQRHNPIIMALIVNFPEIASKLHMKTTGKHVESFFMRLVRDTVAEREKHNIKRNDFLDILIDLKNNKMLKDEKGEEMRNLTLNEVTAQAFIFLSAGFETSSTTMTFALYELARRQDLQEKVREEIEAVYEKHNQEFTYESMQEMPYLDQIISETLRLHTILSILNRKCLEDYVIPHHPEYKLEKGVNIIIPAAAIHRDADYYPNPDVFNPDNFSPENNKARDNIEFLAFGDGPRNCIGKRFGMVQTRLGLAVLLKNFKFSVCEQTKIPVAYKKQSFLTSPDGGVYLKVEKI